MRTIHETQAVPQGARIFGPRHQQSTLLLQPNRPGTEDTPSSCPWVQLIRPPKHQMVAKQIGKIPSRVKITPITTSRQGVQPAAGAQLAAVVLPLAQARSRLLGPTPSPLSLQPRICVFCWWTFNDASLTLPQPTSPINSCVTPASSWMQNTATPSQAELPVLTRIEWCPRRESQLVVAQASWPSYLGDMCCLVQQGARDLAYPATDSCAHLPRARAHPAFQRR